MITRNINPVVLDTLTNHPERMRAFVEFKLNPALRLHTGLGERTLNGQIYYGAGELFSIGAISENASESANRFNISLLLLDPTVITAVSNEDLLFVEVDLHLVALDEHKKIAGSEMDFYNGEIVDKDIVTGDLQKKVPYKVSVTCSDWYERWSQPAKSARISDAAQQLLYPGDKIFDQVEVISSASLADIPIHSITTGGGGSRIGSPGKPVVMK